MEYRIGRNADNDIIVNQQSVSRYHGIIRVSENQMIYEDLGSSNGSFINGNRVTGPVLINDNDIIKVGTELIPWRNYLIHNSDRTEIVQVNDVPQVLKNKVADNSLPKNDLSREGSNVSNQQVHQQVIVNNNTKSSNGFGVAGFVLGLIGLFTFPFFILGFLGFIFSFIGLFRAPRGLAIAGLVISLISLFAALILSSFFF